MNDSIALYRKYRGLGFSDIVGQEHITSALTNAVSDGRISHAYLLTGPHGVGKTSIARILAHKINGIDYTTEDNHLDIVEIDAASNRRIDEIRDLREKAQIAPVSAKYKVYIIDEVHMLTKEAFNALLKTLEEPPSHVVFILATTELHKLPQTIVSRTQRYTFKPISRSDAVSHLRHIADTEKITITDGALQIIADHGNGSFRDAISLIDQIRGLGSVDIDESAVESMLGLARQNEIEMLLQSVYAKDPVSALSSYETIVDTGIQPDLLCKQLVDTIRSSSDYTKQLDLVTQLIEVPKSNSPQLKLELVLLGAAGESVKPLVVSAPQTVPANAPKPPAPVAAKATIKEIENEPTPALQSAKQAEELKPAAAPLKPRPTSAKSDVSDADWKQIVETVKQDNSPIGSILKNCEHQLSGNKLAIGTKFKFHLKKLESVEVKDSISNAADAVLGMRPEIELFLSEQSASAPAQAAVESSDTAADKIISTFGGGEKMEM